MLHYLWLLLLLAFILTQYIGLVFRVSCLNHLSRFTFPTRAWRGYHFKRGRVVCTVYFLLVLSNILFSALVERVKLSGLVLLILMALLFHPPHTRR